VQTLEFIWKYKILWVFGFVIAFFSGGGLNGLGKGFDNSMLPNYRDAGVGSGTDGWLSDSAVVTGDSGTEVWGDLWTSQQEWIWVLIGIVVGFCLLVLVWYFTNVAKVAIVKAVNYDRLKQGSLIKFKNLWVEAHPFLLRILAYDLLLILGSLPFFVVIVVIIFAAGPAAILLICCIWIPLVLCYAVVFYIMKSTGLRLIVLEDVGVMAALSGSWNLFRENLMKYVVAGLVAFIPWIVFIIVSFVLSLFEMGALIVIVGIAYVFVEMSMTAIGVIVGIFGVIGIMIVVAVVHAPFRVFTEVYWTKFIIALKG